ncbi:ferredoxin [Mycobacterium sp.]|jgi:ferredoxin|uniref:ferredoxin n=1 Tax=Mycobacterium sp. TaxID=1785 RepID=UPI003BB218C9
MRARVDAGHCVGHGQCAANAPDVFVLDDLGNAISPAEDIPAQFVEQARRGAAACPERAITLQSVPDRCSAVDNPNTKPPARP